MYLRNAGTARNQNRPGVVAVVTQQQRAKRKVCDRAGVGLKGGVQAKLVGLHRSILKSAIEVFIELAGCTWCAC